MAITITTAMLATDCHYVDSKRGAEKDGEREREREKEGEQGPGARPDLAQCWPIKLHCVAESWQLAERLNK